MLGRPWLSNAGALVPADALGMRLPLSSVSSSSSGSNVPAGRCTPRSAMAAMLPSAIPAAPDEAACRGPNRAPADALPPTLPYTDAPLTLLAVLPPLLDEPILGAPTTLPAPSPMPPAEAVTVDDVDGGADKPVVGGENIAASRAAPITLRTPPLPPVLPMLLPPPPPLPVRCPMLVAADPRERVEPWLRRPQLACCC